MAKELGTRPTDFLMAANTSAVSPVAASGWIVCDLNPMR
jgi:hypothetical protein